MSELAELKKISKILLLANAKTLEEELSKYATNNERKIIWVLIDGNRLSKDIATIMGVTPQAVNRYLSILDNASLIENPWGKPPKKLLDFVPASWLELVKVERLNEVTSAGKNEGELSIKSKDKTDQGEKNE